MHTYPNIRVGLMGGSKNVSVMRDDDKDRCDLGVGSVAIFG